MNVLEKSREKSFPCLVLFFFFVNSTRAHSLTMLTTEFH